MKNTNEWDINSNDAKNYIDICNKILESEELFSNFKTLPEYNVILEHVDYELGEEYLEYIKEVGEEIYNQNLNKFLENDLIGNPKKFLYDGVKISPSTLRYIKNSLDLSSLCEDQKISKIVEIGGGYGGLCKTLSVLCDFDEYVNIDLPEAVKIQEKYLQNFPEVYSRNKFIPCDQLIDIFDIDLLISNYSLSELSIESQLNYYDKVIKNSKVVYITYNLLLDHYSKENYNTIITKMKDDGFNFINDYCECGIFKNIIIAAKK
jgi:hypothetical protein